MSRTTRAIVIDAPASVVWQMITRYDRWPDWGPSVTAVHADSAVVEPGGKGRVVTPPGVSLPFEITAVEPGVSWDWRVGGVPATGHRVEPLDEDRCRVSFSVPLGFYPYVLVLRLGLRNLKALAESVDRHGAVDLDGDAG